ncbi:MAG: DUF721 domain-containing protein [Deltaproteobacteria bacterium]|nr:DUF721 domain-containing protein [Deltaproteobacteria bacterium]
MPREFSANRPFAISEVLAQLLEQHGMGQRRRVLELAAAWRDIVGDPLARHCEPLKLRGRVLEVVVDHSVWMQHLQLRKPHIIAAVNRHAQDELIDDIFWRFGTLTPSAPDAPVPAPELPPANSTPLSPETEALLQALPDASLRRCLRRIIENSAAPGYSGELPHHKQE